MFAKNIRKALVIAVVALTALFIGGTATVASALSVDVKNLHYYDDSGRSIMYGFSSGSVGTVPPNAILLDGNADITRPVGETGTNHFWGRAPFPALPPVTVTLDTEGGKATVSPVSATDGGVAVLFVGGPTLPPPSPPAATTYWYYFMNLGNFNVDLDVQKVYEFDIGLGRDEGAGPYNNATLNIIWVKGFYDGVTYADNTLIIRARVQNGDNELWASTPVVRTGLDPAATTLMFDLSVEDGNHFFAAVGINDEGMTNLGEYTLTTEQGFFQRLPDLFPYLYIGERSASDGGITGGINRLLTYPGGHPPYGFTFATNQVAAVDVAPGDFVITGYEGNQAPYSAYGFLSTGVSVLDLGPMTPEAFDALTSLPTTGYETPSALSLAEGRAYAFRLADGSFGALVVRSVTLDLPAITMAFDYKHFGGGATISFSGMVRTPSLSQPTESLPVVGAVVQAREVVFPLSAGQAYGETSTNDQGGFTISGIPSTPSTFRLIIPTPQGTSYIPVLSQFFSSDTNIQALLPYILFTPDQYNTFGNPSNTGMIRGRVALKDNPASFLAGATIEARPWTPGNPPVLGSPLEVTYTSGTATQADGIYMVKNVPTGTIVQLVAMLANHSFEFNPAPIVPVASGFVSEASFFATTGQQSPFNAYSYHQETSYFINMFVDDPSHAFTGVTVNGPGLVGEVSLVYVPTRGRWEIASSIGLGSTLPTGPRTYNFTATTSATPLTGSKTVSVYVEGFATNLQPTGDITAPPVFSWAGIAGATGYAVVLHDTTADAGVWNSPNLPGSQTSVVYDGPALIVGHTYEYTVISSINTDGNSNSSFARAQFTYSGGATTHPEAVEIQSRFDAAMARFNANDFTEGTGFAAYVSAGYLDRGENKVQFVAAAQQERTAHGLKTWTIQSVTGTGDNAVINILWGDGNIDTMYFHKEGGLWLLYGNQKLFDIWASSGHQMYSTAPLPFWVSLSVEDPNPSSGLTISSVHVTGPGIEGGIDLYHNTTDNRWHSWSQDFSGPDLGPKWATAPTLPLNYVFTINYTGGSGTSEVQTYQIKSFVNTAPAQGSITPASGSTATRPLTFSWASVGAGYRYKIEVSDANYGRIWDSDDTTGTSVTYSGPTLGGGAYVYNLITEDGFGNMSMIQTPFQLPLLYPRTPVTSGTGVADNHPAWSPDGTKLAFTSNRSGLDNIWIVNVDGSGLMQLTTATGYLDAKYPSWSPNGAKIAYISHDADPQIGGFGAYYLYTMNPDGSGQMRHPLPPRTTQDSGDQFWEFEIKFTEWLDNDRIAFVSYGPDGGSYKLYSYRLSTGAVTQIIPSPEEVNPDGDIYRISWNAAKGRLAYDRWPIGIQTITDTGANYQILNIPRIGQMDTPAQAGWRPDGNQLAFVKNYYGASNIAIFDPASGTVLVEQTASDDEWPAWSPDGGRIAFVSDGLIKLMTLTSPTVSVTGKVNNWEGTAPLAGVTVDLLGSDSPQSTTTDGSGNFSFSNIPAGQSFYLRFRSTGLVDVYTGDLSFNGAMASVDLGTYSLPATTDLTRFNLGPGKGIIMGRIQDQQLADGARIGGVVVTATSQTHPAPGYTVTYQDPLGNLGGTATYGNGRYYVLNVDEDTVTVRATKGNRTPVQRLFHTFAGAVNQGSLRTAAPGYDLSIGGIVSDSSGTVQGGATVAINRYPAKSMTTGENGAYQLANLPRDANMSLKITKGGFLPAYTAGFNLGGSNLAGIPLTLFNQTDFNNMGIQTGRGLIAGRVVSDTLAPQAGARITAVSNKGQTYVVQYGQGGGTATLANGAFWIPNVVNGDVVTITVAHSGYIYSGVSYMEAVADAVVEKLFIGTLRKADINGDGRVDLADAILVMKVMAGIPPGTLGIRANYPTSGADVNGDNLVGAHELIYIIQYLGGLRP